LGLAQLPVFADERHGFKKMMTPRSLCIWLEWQTDEYRKKE